MVLRVVWTQKALADLRAIQVVQLRSMREMSVHDFRSHLGDAVEKVVEDHVPLRVKRRAGQDFVVISAEDWERETLYVLQNRLLMEQIERSLKGKLPLL